MAEPIIRLTGLTKHFGGGENEVAALNDINIEIQRGEIFGVIGLSGAGKSTLVRCINLLERPTTGSVVVDGKEMILSGYSMNELEQILEGYNFYRCYQSFIVNLSRVSYVRADNEAKNFALIFEGYAGEVMVSRDKYTEVLQLLKNKYAKLTL